MTMRASVNRRCDGQKHKGCADHRYRNFTDLTHRFSCFPNVFQ
jgi:hypothetical protein